jgi:hypothetical protein
MLSSIEIYSPDKDAWKTSRMALKNGRAGHGSVL